ncbi:ISL3 family transposase [Nonomuraea rhizosphaerae]|uniref:ISL3 family transposase n=1 Tax=Nonomuraea rhizosphaerae TaxID=2665663 RepID=UPI0027E29D24|nr:ISL3 family transposase [Nonomuraea rhizosphaerae]
MRTSTTTAACPTCGTVSDRRHGGYRRRLADLAVAGCRTVISLLVSRFACRAAECPRKTFVEQVDGLTEPFARRTPLLRRLLERVVLATGGRPAARLTAHLAVTASANSLLRLIRKLPDKVVGSAPRVLGVDDFATRKGHIYATILVDMETGERVDVLPDRTADTFAAWLRAHPGVQLVCRDRGGAYAEAVRSAAPDAVQVADRFHVWKNLCDAVDKCVAAHRVCLAETAAEVADQDGTPSTADQPAPVPPQVEGRRAATRRERHAAVHALLDKGVGISAIAQALGLDRKTVRRYAQAPSPQDMLSGPVRRGTCVDAFLPYLHQRWNEGCTDTARLFAEIQRQGYQGSKRTLRRHFQDLRAGGVPAPKAGEELTVRRATRLLTSHPDHLDEAGTLRLKKLRARCPELDAVAGCVAAFATMMTNRNGHLLSEWLHQAEATGFQPLRSLVRGLRQDFDAVTAGLTLDWNSGRVEGNVNRIKRIKRDGYGRAGFDLLRLQILHAD